MVKQTVLYVDAFGFVTMRMLYTGREEVEMFLNPAKTISEETEAQNGEVRHIAVKSGGVYDTWSRTAADF